MVSLKESFVGFLILLTRSRECKFPVGEDLKSRCQQHLLVLEDRMNAYLYLPIFLCCC